MQTAPQARQALEHLQENLGLQAPLDLIISIYDFAIQACAQRDKDKVSKALVELMASLNFEYRETAGDLFRLYEFCIRRARCGDFDAVNRILADLRGAWNSASRQLPAKAAS